MLAVVFGTVFSLTANIASATRNPDDKLLYITPDGNRSYYKDSVHGSCYYEDKEDTRFQRNVDCGSIEGQEAWYEKILGSLGEITAKGIEHAVLLAVDFIVTGIANFLFILSNFLGLVITLLILGMGGFVNGPASTGIQEAWKIIRDIANIGIVGGLVATAIGTIIQSKSYNINVTLAKLIIAALLVNFSYFFAGALIDIANVTTVAVYKSSIITTTCAPGANCAGDPGKGFVDRILGAVKFKTVADESGKVVLEEESTKTGGIVYNLLLAIFMLILGFYLLQVIFLLLVRFVALIFLLITSPAGIAGVALPIIKTYVDSWWKALYTQSLFPIVFFLLTGVALTVMEKLHPAIIQATAGKGASVDFFGQAISFMIAFAFLSIALRVAKQLSEQAEWFKGLYTWTNKNLATPAGKLYQFPMALALRQSVGQAADFGRLAYRDLAARNRFDKVLGGAPDRFIQKTLDGLANQKFLGREGFKTVREEERKREKELTDAEKKERQLGRLGIGGRGLAKEDKDRMKELENLEKAGTISSAEKKELEQLRQWDKQGGALGDVKAKQKQFLDEYEQGEQRKGESDKDYRERQQARGDLGRRYNADTKTWEDMYAYYDRLDKDPTIGYRDAREGAERILGSLPDQFWQDEYHKNPESIIGLASILPKEQFLQMMKNGDIRRDIRDAMWKERRGWYASKIKQVQDEVDRDELLEGSAEYQAKILPLYNWVTNNVDHDEFEQMVLSSAPFDDEGHRFEDLRGTGALWQGSSTTAFKKIRDNKLLGETESRKVRQRKALPLDTIRDKEAGAYLILGYDEEDPDYLPKVDGTVNYHAADRSREWADRVLGKNAGGLKAYTHLKLIENYESDPVNHNGVSDGDYREAQLQVRYAKMIKAGKSANPLQQQIEAAEKAAEAAITDEQIAAARARGISKAEFIAGERKVAKGKLIYGLQQQYQTAVQDIVEQYPNDPVKQQQEVDKLLADDAMFVASQLVAVEQKMADYHFGKNDQELKGILSKRNYWSTSTAYGATKNVLYAVDGQDEDEVARHVDGLLARGPAALVKDMMTNPDIRAKYSWPTPDRIRRINIVRRARGEEELPEQLP